MGFSGSVIENGLNRFALTVGGHWLFSVYNREKSTESDLFLAVLEKGLTSWNLRGKKL